MLFTWEFVAKDDGEVCDCSTGNESDDLFMVMPSSCSCCSSAIVAGWVDVKRVSFSSCDCGDVGGEPGNIVMGGGDETAKFIGCCVVNIGSVPLIGESGGSEIQIEAVCCIVNLFFS